MVVGSWEGYERRLAMIEQPHHSGPHHQLHTFTIGSTSTTKVNFTAQPVLRARFHSDAGAYFPEKKENVGVSSLWSDPAKSGWPSRPLSPNSNI